VISNVNKRIRQTIGRREMFDAAGLRIETIDADARADVNAASK
jgi:hypothetical protein